MKRENKIVLLMILTLALSGLRAKAAPNIFGNITLPENYCQQEDERLKQLREQELTDSLLNSITVDSLTREVYAMFPPHLNAPKILGKMDDTQFRVLVIPEKPFTTAVGVSYEVNDSTIATIYPTTLPDELTDPIPLWFQKSLRLHNQMREASVKMMITNPASVEYADWELPRPPRLPKEDFSMHAFLKRLHLPEVDLSSAVIPEVEIPKKHWLHFFNVALQFSQAYVSPNWYQGGNSYISGLFNFTWNVDLNQNFHPNLLFQSSLQYRLAVNSNPKGSLHKVNMSQDLFQYTLKTGLKAFNHWFYSLNLLFQTQMFNAYPEDSKERTSAFLSPGTFNAGLGMTYTLEKKGLNMTVTISPLAYNLKTCIFSDIDHEQFNIPQNRKTLSEIGSSAEAAFTWKFNDMLSWKTRLFLFTNYDYFLADWENTLNFQFNKYLSTQIFLHPRFDSSSEMKNNWNHWMLHEILSFGISYTFATPK